MFVKYRLSLFLHCSNNAVGKWIGEGKRGKAMQVCLGMTERRQGGQSPEDESAPTRVDGSAATKKYCKKGKLVKVARFEINWPFFSFSIVRHFLSLLDLRFN